VKASGERLRERLEHIAEEFDEALEVRGEGLMLGLELSVPGRPIVEAALKLGVMLNCVQGTVLRFLPPLILTEAQVDQAMDVLDTVMGEMFARRAIQETQVASVA
jgi:acetylornithine/N-succinyldiaminopimelate aminotransferase